MAYIKFRIKSPEDKELRKVADRGEEKEISKRKFPELILRKCSWREEEGAK